MVMGCARQIILLLLCKICRQELEVSCMGIVNHHHYGHLVFYRGNKGELTLVVSRAFQKWSSTLVDDDEPGTLDLRPFLGKRFNMDFPLVLTGLFLASVPPIIAYIVLQRFIRRGLVAGAIK